MAVLDRILPFKTNRILSRFSFNVKRSIHDYYVKHTTLVFDAENLWNVRYPSLPWIKPPRS